MTADESATVVYTWGNGNQGRLGHGCALPESRPRRVQFFDENQIGGVYDVGCGENWTALLSGSGRLFLWGSCTDNVLTALAPATVKPYIEEPTEYAFEEFVDLDASSFGGSVIVRRIACGSHHILALTDTGKVLAWGRGNKGQLGGNGYGSNYHPVLVQLPEDELVLQVRAYGDYSAALSGTITLILQAPMTVIPNRHSHVPVNLTELNPQFQNHIFTYFSCGKQHMGAIDGDNALYTWGKNPFGVLGYDLEAKDGDPSSLCPRQVESLKHEEFIYINCGAQQTAAITTRYDLYTWGRSAGLEEVKFQPSRRAADQSGIFGLSPIQTTELDQTPSPAPSSPLPMEPLTPSKVWGSVCSQPLDIPKLAFQWSSKPRQVKALISKNMDGAFCGREFTIASTELGRLYTWGDGSFGRLGLGAVKSTASPQLIEYYAQRRPLHSKEDVSEYCTSYMDCNITRMCCGPTHCIAVAGPRAPEEATAESSSA